MLKLPLSLLVVLLSVSATQAQTQNQDAHRLNQLQGNAHVLIVFSPDSSSPSFKKQLDLLERHSFELAVRNTVVVPVSTASNFGEQQYSFENLPIGTVSEQAEARSRFHVLPGDFVVILLDQDGTQQIRSVSPVDIHALIASLDAPTPPTHLDTPAQH